MFARFLNQTVNQTEIVFLFFGLDQLPVNGHQNCVEVSRNQLGPDRPHVFETGRTGIAQLAAQDQKRLVVDNQLSGCALFAEMWSLTGICLAADSAY